jgi:hypothetical protein
MNVFKTAPATYQQAWQLIKGLVKEWHGVELSWQLETYRSQITAIESQVGVALPASFQQWYAFLQTMKDTHQWLFRDSYRIQFEPQLQAISLLIQGESDYLWAIKKENCHLDDPPVDGYQLEVESTERLFLWQKTWSARLSFFAIKYLLDYHHSFEGMGGYDASGFDMQQAMHSFHQEFGQKTIIENYHIFERKGVLAVITEDNCFSGLPNLAVHYQISKEQLPACVIDYFRYCHCYSGPKL